MHSQSQLHIIVCDPLVADEVCMHSQSQLHIIVCDQLVHDTVFSCSSSVSQSVSVRSVYIR
jgi:hypothetical protein